MQPEDYKALSSLRVALVHDWLFHMRGGEKCLKDFCNLFPNSEVFALFYDKSAKLDPVITNRPIHSSILNKLSSVKNYYKKLLLFFPIGMQSLSKQLELSHHKNPFDLVISISHCSSKNIVAPKGVKHLCYCLTPARYLWGQFGRYVRNPLIQFLASPLLIGLRALDRRSKVDHWFGISRFIAGRIFTAYGKEAEVIYPAVELVADGIPLRRSEFFLVVNELVPYKNTDKIVEAFNNLGLPLVIVGKGPDENQLKSIAKDNIQFRSNLSRLELEALYRQAKAFVFAAEEDFGMTPVEAQSAGLPVIALGRGGVLETVIESPIGAKSGLFFRELTAASIGSAVNEFIKSSTEYSAQACKKSANRFNKIAFDLAIFKALTKLGILKDKTALDPRRSGQTMASSV